jgi:hypothetical protein
MRPVFRGQRRTSSLLLCAAACLAAGWIAAGCYNPKIDEGAFFCADGGACPEGFGCDQGRCFKNEKAAVGLCVPPASSAGTCDLVCQTGCSGGQQCLPMVPKPACMDVKVNPKAVQASCGAADICSAGSLCVPDRGDNAACGSHCFRLCYKNEDCGAASRCLDQLTINDTGQKYGLCSSDIENCNPIGVADCGRRDLRPSPPFACYVLSLDEPDLTVCECAGTIEEGQPCEHMHDCKPGLECVVKDRQSICRQLCTPDGSNLPAVIACHNPLLRCKKFDNGHGRHGYCI